MRDPHIVQHRQIAEQPDILEGATDAQRGNLMRRLAHQFGSLEADTAFRGLINPGNQVEDGGFAGAVGTDDAHQFAGVEIQIEIGDRAQAAEEMPDLSRGQQRHMAFPPCKRFQAMMGFPSRPGIKPRNSRNPMMPRGQYKHHQNQQPTA